MPSNYYLQIENTPSTLIRMVDAIRPDQYDTSLEEGRFTLKEVIAHLADLELTWLDRITTAVEYPGKAVENFDEEARAIEHKYSEKEIHHELEVFENRRRDTVDYLLRLAEDDWTSTITHPKFGEMTIIEIVQYITGHDLYHINQVSQYLK
jgi:uncharacterized damage-inducible protein DinB